MIALWDLGGCFSAVRKDHKDKFSVGITLPGDNPPRVFYLSGVVVDSCGPELTRDMIAFGNFMYVKTRSVYSKSRAAYVTLTIYNETVL